MATCKQKLIKNLHWLFLAGAVLLTLYMDVYMASHILDGDASQLFARGWIMAQKKNLFTSDVYLTTEVSFLDTSAVAAFFFLFISDWTLVRILTTLALQGWYLIAFLFLCRQSGVRLTHAVYAAGMLLMPVSIPYARVVLYHMYYLPNVANMFWLMGLAARIVSAGKEQKRTCTWILLGISWFLAGLEGVRYMLIIGVPMLAYLFFDMLQLLKKYQWDGRRLTGPIPVQDTNTFVLLRMMLVVCLCFVAGYVVNQTVLLRAYEVSNSSQSTFWPEAPAQRYADIFHGWLKANGIRASYEQLVGVRGMALVASLVFSCGVIGMSVRGVPGRYQEEDKPHRQLIRGLFAASLTTTTLIFLLDSGSRIYELYYIPVVVLSFPVLAQEMSVLKEQAAAITRKLLLLAVCLCVLFQGAYSFWFIRADHVKLDTWNGLWYKEIDTIDRVRSCVDFMQENGYTHGLINYWYASTMMEMTDGELIMAGVTDNYQPEQGIELWRWGAPKSAFEPENLPEKIMVFIERQEIETFEKAFPDLPLVHKTWLFNGYEVDSSLIY